MHVMIIKAIHTFVHTSIHMHVMITKKKRLSAWRGHKEGRQREAEVAGGEGEII